MKHPIDAPQIRPRTILRHANFYSCSHADGKFVKYPSSLLGQMGLLSLPSPPQRCLVVIALPEVNPTFWARRESEYVADFHDSRRDGRMDGI